MQATTTVSRTGNTKPMTDDERSAVTSKADALSMRVYGLASVLKVFAFAAEARKALVSLEAAFEHRPKVRDDLHNHAYLANWSEMPDASSDALQFIAQEFEQVMEQSVEMIYGLADHLRERDPAAEMERKPA